MVLVGPISARTTNTRTLTQRSFRSGTVRRSLQRFVVGASIILLSSYLWLLSFPLPEQKNDVPLGLLQLMPDDYGAPTFRFPLRKALTSRLQQLDSRLIFLEAGEDEEYADFGDIDYEPAGADGGIRSIHHLAYLKAERYREKLESDMNEEEKNLAKRTMYHDDKLKDDPPRNCYRNNWKSKFFPTCNNFHDHDIVESVVEEQLKYRGSGFFRDAWSHADQNNEVWILKTMRRERPGGIRMLQGITKEAIIMERLSSSPRIVDIYGFCGFSTIVENMPYELEDEIHSTLERNDVKDRYESSDWQYPMNNLTTPEKLNVAIAMAESLADIHGYAGGIIVHADAHPVQWLLNEKGVVKFNDFNNAIIMDWSYEKNAYCPGFRNIPGTFHAPEEHKGEWTVDDRIDVYAMGAVLFTILTGLYPFWQYHYEDRHSRIKHGEVPPIDERYRRLDTVEGKIVQTMEKCYISESQDRPEIFQIVQELKTIRTEFFQ